MAHSLPSQVVVLVRHGDARPKDEDPTKSLSNAGREHVKLVSSLVAAVGPMLDEVRHSGKARARQTAEVFADVVGVAREYVREESGLSPNDDVKVVADQLEAEGRSVAIVGHLPFMNRLASLLLCGDPQQLDLHFDDAGCMVLGRTEGGWRLVGFLNHDLAR
jgi:phosphohistidine phosphatase